MEIRYFDTHSHLNFSTYDEDRAEVIGRMQEAGVATIGVGTSMQTSDEVVQLAESYPNMFASVGVHPTDVESGFIMERMQELASRNSVVAIGECGLDYFRLPEDLEKCAELKEKQVHLFRQHIELARARRLPLMLHIRPRAGTMDAYEDALDILDELNNEEGYSGTAHFFVGSSTIAERFVQLGFHVSFSGPVTFADEYEEVVRSLPLERILSETDAPFAAPSPMRGKRNEPAYVVHVVEAVATIRGEDVEHVRKNLLRNAQKLFLEGQNTASLGR